MADPWVEELYQQAEELGWRVISSSDGPGSNCWKYAAGHRSQAEWHIRVLGQGQFWIVHHAHHWGMNPAGQVGSLGPFDSFLAAATTWHLAHD